ncbi:DMT family transporter, partial [bacterium]
MKPSSAGSAKIALCFAVWSTWALFSRNIGLPWEALVFSLSFLTAIFSFLWAFAKGEGVGKPSLALATLGVLLFLNNLAFFYAIEKTTVANALFTHYMAPVLVAIFAPLLIGEKKLRHSFSCLGASLLGLYLLLPPGLSGSDLKGTAAGLFSAAAYAGMVIMVRKYAISTASLRIIFWQNLTVTILTAPLAFMADFRVGAGGAILLVFLGLFHSVAVPLFYLSGIRSVRAQTAAILGYIEPLGAVFLAALFLGEKLPPTAWAGCI